MRTVFLEARSDVNVDISSYIQKLPSRIGLCATVQFIGSIKKIKIQLEKNKKKVFLLEGKHTRYKGQILGCESDAIKNLSPKVDCFLYVGDGVFHPKLILLESNKPVFIFNPFTKKFFVLEEKEINKIKIKKRIAKMKLLSATNIGILVSTKPGQQQLKRALRLKEMLEKNGKNAFILIDNTFDFNSLQNFPFLEVLINTMCPRVALDDYESIKIPIINIEEAEELINSQIK